MTVYYDLESSTESSVNYRWMQPPQIAYLVSTVDEYGNANLTPVTLGTLVCAQYPREGRPGSYFFTFSVGRRHLADQGNELEPRHAFLNLQKNGECVISYLGYNLMRQSIICNMPIPYGISEFDVAGLTPLPSGKVAPFSVAECPVNMECRVEHSYDLDGYYQMYVCRVVALAVQEGYVQRDTANGGLGVFAIDPLFEVQVDRDADNRQLRLYYGRLDPKKIHRTADDFGCLEDWVGSFGTWIASEQARGKLAPEEADELLALEKAWRSQRDPVTNAAVKEQLSARLARLCR